MAVTYYWQNLGPELSNSILYGFTIIQMPAGRVLDLLEALYFF